MAKITPLDRLFITVTQHGISRHMAELTGITSISDIVNCMRAQVPNLVGMASISIRNATEGWTTTKSVFLH